MSLTHLDDCKTCTWNKSQFSQTECGCTARWSQIPRLPVLLKMYPFSCDFEWPNSFKQLQLGDAALMFEVGFCKAVSILPAVDGRQQLVALVVSYRLSSRWLLQSLTHSRANLFNPYSKPLNQFRQMLFEVFFHFAAFHKFFFSNWVVCDVLYLTACLALSLRTVSSHKTAMTYSCFG